MTTRYWPLSAGRTVTSPFGPRQGGFHYGVDFGRNGGSAGMPVYAIQSGTVIHAGAADGYGGPDPAGWLVIDSTDTEGGGCLEYGHIIREVDRGARVTAGQRIGRINPDSRTNGGTAPHLHLSDMPRGYDPAAKQDPLPRLRAALEPGGNPVPDNRPDFNEFPIWSPSHSARTVKVDSFLLHTQEGGGGDAAAENLAKYLGVPANKVSYHYTVSQAADGGVTVVDVVDTDRAAWSVLSANGRSINLCFAGSRASWTRAEWLKQAKAIDVAAYLAVQDAKKYGFPAKVISYPYTSKLPGISDHFYVTEVLGEGSHTDVGKGFPWDVFAAAVAKYAGQVVAPKPGAPAKPAPVGPADDQVSLRWNSLGGQTLVEAVAEIRDKLLGTHDRGKTGAK